MVWWRDGSGNWIKCPQLGRRRGMGESDGSGGADESCDGMPTDGLVSRRFGKLD